MPKFHMDLSLEGRYRGLHCTLVPTFESRFTADWLIPHIENVLVEIKEPMSLTAVQRALFGKNGERLVYELEDTGELRALHENLCNALEKNGLARILGRYSRENYKPHISDGKNICFPPGVEWVASRVRLVEMFKKGPNITRCVWRIDE
ncbi:MAG: hypothetical protein A2854_04065 [Parcubacteria group bacterium RIFCSPHIGHO2_01_FULL_56_18]|nr:MAG: hypothetical protein A2854_04065 [Parcubacteria group bacterium RIFCSPHIGHO2_01_FULL_56_18]